MLASWDTGVHMGQRAADRGSAVGDGGSDVGVGKSEGSLGHALGLTVASAAVWGIAHFWAGRRVAGFVLMSLFVILIGGGVIIALDYQPDLKQIAVRRDWLAGITGGMLALALFWAIVVVRSYQVVRPSGMA